MSYAVTKSRILQYIGIILILAVFAGAYWYFKVYGSTLNQSQNDLNTNGLVGMWSFNGDDISGTTAYDRGTGGNNGTITNTPTRVLGKVSQALSFNGTTQYVTVAQASSINTFTALTVSAWVKPTVTSGNYIIVRKNNDTGGTNHDLYQLDISSNKFRFLVAANASGVQTAGNDTTITAGIWYHVVGTWDGTTVKLYVDAAQQPTTDTLSGTIATSTFSALGIGRSNDTTDAYFSGIIDEVRIYSRAVAVGEIQSLYTAGGGTKSNTSISQPQGTGRLDSGLAGYWPLDNGSGTSATDASTNGNTGTLTGGPTWGTGQIGGAVTFDGTDDYIEIGSSVKVDNSDRGVIAGWIKFTSWSSIDATYNPIFSYGGPGAASAGNLLLEQRYFTNTHYLAVEQGNNGETRDIVRGSTALSLSTWYHIAVVSDGSSYKLYLNGVPETLTVFSGSNTGDWFSDTSLGETDRSVIGARWGNGALGAPVAGSIDEVRIYNRPLPQDEIFQLYSLTAPTGVDTGLKGYWSFNGQDMLTSTTTADRSGANNNGTLTNGPVKVVGKVSQALSFDGSDDYVTVADSATLDIGDTDDLTLSGWLFRDTFTTDDTVIAKRNGIAAGDAGYIVYIDDATDQLIFEVSDGTDEYSLTSSSIFTATGWNHFAIVWDQDSATNSEIYVNGVANSATDTGTIGNIGDLSNAVTFRTGAESDNGNPYDGNLDEVRVYKRALTAAEIKGHYDAGESDKTNSSVSQPQGTGRLDSGLTGYWKMDENTGTNAADSSTNGNTGTLTNGPTWTTGQIGSAVTFDGSNDYISVGTGTVGIPTGSKELTLSSFVNVTTFQSYTAMISKAQAGSPFGGWQINTNADTGNRFGGGVNVSGSWIAVTSVNTYSTGVWYHVSMTYDGVTLRLYVNGVLDNTASGSGTIQYANAASEVNIGRNAASDAPSRYLTGSLDEVRVYNRTLSADEISQLYRLTAPTGVDTGLKGYWSFNGQDVSGTTAYDRSGAGNTGTLTNGPTKVIGKLGQALSFDGTNDYVDISTVTLAGEFTYSFWYKTSNNAQTGMMLGADSTGGTYAKFGLVSGNYFIRVVGGGSTDNTITPGSTNQWHHVVITRDSSNKIDLYVDGGSANRLFSNVAQSGSTNLTWIAISEDSQIFSGQMDEVRVYNRALTAAEIIALYNASR